MSEKPIISAAVPEKTKEKVDSYAEREGISRSEAVNRLLEQGIDVSRSDVTVIYGGEEQIVTDGSGIKSAVQESKRRESRLQTEIEELRSDIHGLAPSLSAGLVWIGLVSALELPMPVVVGTGIAVIGFLVWSYYRVIVRD
jgi:hypothetical protein